MCDMWHLLVIKIQIIRTKDMSQDSDHREIRILRQNMISIFVRCLHSSSKPTCKLPVAVAAVTELGDQLAIQLEDEDAAGFVVHHDDVSIPVHRDAFGAHQLPGTNLILEKSSSVV